MPEAAERLPPRLLRQRLTGRTATLRRPLTLRADPLRLELDGSVVRHVRHGDVEILEQVYGTIRDEPWNTIPGKVVAEEVERAPDAFRAAVTTRHRYRDIDYLWTAEIEGAPDGTLTCVFRGRALATGNYMRIGLNLVHPAAEYAGRTYRAAGGAGPSEGRLPDRIATVALAGGIDVALIPAFNRLDIELDGLGARFAFAGDLFELEDQRNWGDAAFKSFGMPLSRPAPFLVATHEVLEQRLVLRCSGRARRRPRERVLGIGGRTGKRFPALGTAIAADCQLSPRGEALIRTAGLRHLRVDLDAEAPEASARLAQAAAVARRLSLPLEIGLLAGPDHGGIAALLVPAARPGGPKIARVVAMPRAGTPEAAGPAGAGLLEAVRSALCAQGEEGPVVVGTDEFFCELNRADPDHAPVDGVAFPMSPAVHVWDDVSVMANLAAIASQIEQAGEVARGGPVHAGPVTLATRHGPFPCGPEGSDGLPAGVDPRQAAQIGAAWSVGCLAGLAAGGAASATLFETVGWRGLVERAEGSPDPAHFGSSPDAPNPLWHVIADVAELAGRPVRAVTVPDPRAAAVLALDTGNGTRVLVANLRPRSQRLLLGGLGEGSGRMRRLGVREWEAAHEDPEGFRASFETIAFAPGPLELTLTPYEVVRLDLPAGPA